MEDLVVLGTGNVDIIRLIEDINIDKKQYNFLGFLESDENLIGKDIFGYPVLGNDDLLMGKLSHCAVVNNIMKTPFIHKEVSDKLFHEYHITNTPNIIHPDVDLRFVSLGVGNIVYKGMFFGTKTKIGDFNIFYGGSIGHGTIFGNYNLYAGNVIGSKCTIGDYNLFGNSSTVSNNVKVGDSNIVGVGCVLMRNVKSHNHLLGYPAVHAEEFMKEYLKHILKN